MAIKAPKLVRVHENLLWEGKQNVCGVKVNEEYQKANDYIGGQELKIEDGL